MGVCPQFDILWSELTGREHLYIYGILKARLQTTQTSANTLFSAPIFSGQWGSLHVKLLRTIQSVMTIECGKNWGWWIMQCSTVVDSGRVSCRVCRSRWSSGRRRSCWQRWS